MPRNTGFVKFSPVRAALATKVQPVSAHRDSLSMRRWRDHRCQRPTWRSTQIALETMLHIYTSRLWRMLGLAVGIAVPGSALYAKMRHTKRSSSVFPVLDQLA